jgi:hypothetical protein
LLLPPWGKAGKGVEYYKTWASLGQRNNLSNCYMNCEEIHGRQFCGKPLISFFKKKFINFFGNFSA